MPIIAQWKNRHTESKLAELNTENLAILTKLDLVCQNSSIESKKIFDSTLSPEKWHTVDTDVEHQVLTKSPNTSI